MVHMTPASSARKSSATTHYPNGSYGSQKAAGSLFDLDASPSPTDASPPEEIGLDTALVRAHPSSFSKGDVRISRGDALGYYHRWASPVCIVSDGPYGVHGYPGDPWTPEGLGDCYEPHIVEWSKKATPQTTLWFWNTEVGWANVHPVLVRHGWEYRGASIWNKGIAHMAGNVNTKTMRRVPPITEVCVHYTRVVTFKVEGRVASMKEWLRHEWVRSGLPLRLTNAACGVIDAATRKYFTQCHLWYFPPADAFAKLSAYANEHGRPEGRPYFSLDGKHPLTGVEWERMRAKFELEHGVTNVWTEPAVRGTERVKSGLKALHSNQKPLRLVELTIRMTTDPGDMVWEPFGGLCTGAIASARIGRRCEAAEISDDFYGLAISRLARL